MNAAAASGAVGVKSWQLYRHMGVDSCCPWRRLRGTVMGHGQVEPRTVASYGFGEW